MRTKPEEQSGYRDRAKERREGKSEDLNIDELIAEKSELAGPLAAFAEPGDLPL